MTFDILQNQRAKHMISGMLKADRLPHSLLIEGAAGCGKRTLGGYVAAAVLCEGAGEHPCGLCNHCRKMLSDCHPDFQVLDGGEDSKVFSRDNLRELRRQASLAPNEGKARVYLLAETQHMTPETQNLMLKLIEEPPRGSYFIMTCPNRHMMLPTIRSRVVSIAVEPLSCDACAEQLQKRYPDADPQICSEVAELCGGSLGRGMIVIDLGERSPERQAADIVTALMDKREYEALALLTALEKPKNPREGYRRVLGCACVHLRRELLKAPNTPLNSRLKLVEILDTSLQRVEQNMGLSLVSAALCAGASEL